MYLGWVDLYLECPTLLLWQQVSLKPDVQSALSWSIRMQSFGSLKGIYDMTEIARIIQAEIERERETY